MVRQLASLLAAGRTGPALWGALGHVLAVEADSATGVQGDRRENLWPAGRSQAPSELPQLRINGPPRAADATILLVLAVQRASALGLPASASIREACAAALVHGPGNTTVRGAALTVRQHGTWLELAACFEVCEVSGAAMAAVLNRLAAAIEAEQDAAALRETALAGPRATVRLLSWLPFIGLGLGTTMGVDPIGALLGGPLGWAVMAAGVACALAGWAWSRKMISDAAAPPSFPRIPSGGKTAGTQFPECRQS
ncbi:type II secretion system F family protein [Arthrobacter sp. HLT1-20]